VIYFYGPDFANFCKGFLPKPRDDDDAPSPDLRGQPTIQLPESHDEKVAKLMSDLNAALAAQKGLDKDTANAVRKMAGIPEDQPLGLFDKVASILKTKVLGDTTIDSSSSVSSSLSSPGSYSDYFDSSPPVPSHPEASGSGTSSVGSVTPIPSKHVSAVQLAPPSPILPFADALIDPTSPRSPVELESESITNQWCCLSSRTAAGKAKASDLPPLDTEVSGKWNTNISTFKTCFYSGGTLPDTEITKLLQDERFIAIKLKHPDLFDPSKPFCFNAKEWYAFYEKNEVDSDSNIESIIKYLQTYLK
jgi:hypothetical protein